jgi:hypothetical protein
MPAKSGKQYRLMAMIAHGGKPSITGPSESVAREFVKKTPKKKRKQWANH